jgi:hypothetical protein
MAIIYEFLKFKFISKFQFWPVSFLETAIASERMKQQLYEIRDILRCTTSIADVPKLPKRKIVNIFVLRGGEGA